MMWYVGVSPMSCTLTISRDWKEHNKYVAIPQGDIDATKGTEFELKQNPGY